MRDKFQKAIHKKIFNAQKEVLLPNDYVLINGVRSNVILNVSLSMDNIDKFINTFGQEEYHLDVPIDITIYDEFKIVTSEDISKRYKLISILNSLPLVACRLNLSDENIGLYSNMLNEMRYVWPSHTLVTMTLDRNPLVSKEYLNLLSLPAHIDLKEEDLLSLSEYEIRRLRQKMLETDTVEKTLGLKGVVNEYCEEMDRTYHVSALSDYEKIYMAYKYVHDNIRYPYEFVLIDENDHQSLKPGSPSYIHEPYGTFIEKEGVCVGQSRLMVALLNNSFMKVPSVTIDGHIPQAAHQWVGSVVDDNLFETCVTINGPFKPLKKLGYTYDKHEVYPRVYNQAYLLNSDIDKVTQRLRLARKK